MGRPKTPAKRCNMWPDVFLFCAFYICFLSFALFTTDNNGLFMLSFSSLVCAGMFLLIRLVWFLRELLMWRHMYTSYSQLLMRNIKINHWPSLLLTCCINFTILLFYWPADGLESQSLFTAKKYSLVDLMVSHIFTVMGLYFQWHDCPLLESYRLEKSFSFSGGSCMALGYFCGYLKLILPDLLDRINKFQSREQIVHEKIKHKKLFILIPSSTFIFNKLRQTGIDDIEPLEEKVDSYKQDRGMTLNREYKVTVYKIKDKNDISVTKYYVPLEGASPLKTFEETCRLDPIFKEHKREVISSFYYTLHQLLSQDREVDGLVELIYYDDEKNNSVEIADVVRERMKYLNKKDKKKMS